MAEHARSEPGPAAAPGALRKLLHLTLVAAGWIGFVWLWLLVSGRPWDSQRLVWLIAGSVFVAPLATAIWVWHNRAIYRRKGERRAVTAVADSAYLRDWRGRSVRADWAALAVSPLVMIQIDEQGRKQYLGVGSSRPSRAASVEPARPQKSGGDENGPARPAPVRG